MSYAISVTCFIKEEIVPAATSRDDNFEKGMKNVFLPFLIAIFAVRLAHDDPIPTRSRVGFTCNAGRKKGEGIS